MFASPGVHTPTRSPGRLSTRARGSAARRARALSYHPGPEREPCSRVENSQSVDSEKPSPTAEDGLWWPTLNCRKGKFQHATTDYKCSISRFHSCKACWKPAEKLRKPSANTCNKRSNFTQTSRSRHSWRSKCTGNYRYHYQCDQLYIIGRHSDRGKPSSVPRVHHPPRIPYIGREATGEGAGIPHPRDRLYTSPPLTRNDRGTTGPHPLTACVYNLWYAAPGPTRSP